MVKCYGEFLDDDTKFQYSIIAEDAKEADEKFLKIAKKNKWQYTGIIKIKELGSRK